MRGQHQRARVAASASSSASRAAMSRWLVGSSSSSRLAGRSSSLASASRLRSPPESAPTGLNTSSPLNRKRPSRSRSRPASQLAGAAGQTSSRTRAGRVEVLRLVLREVRRPSRRAPASACPRVGRSRRPASAAACDLPAPFGPDQRHPLAALERQRHAVEDRPRRRTPWPTRSERQRPRGRSAGRPGSAARSRVGSARGASTRSSRASMLLAALGLGRLGRLARKRSMNASMPLDLLLLALVGRLRRLVAPLRARR